MANVKEEIQTPFGRLQIFDNGISKMHPDDKDKDTAIKFLIKKKYRS